MSRGNLVTAERLAEVGGRKDGISRIAILLHNLLISGISQTRSQICRRQPPGQSLIAHAT
jgi:hypothetical protein